MGLSILHLVHEGSSYCFLFLIRLRFLQSKSVSQIVRSRYGDTTIKKRLLRFLKIDYHLRKAELDLEFLVRCRDNNVI